MDNACLASLAFLPLDGDLERAVEQMRSKRGSLLAALPRWMPDVVSGVLPGRHLAAPTPSIRIRPRTDTKAPPSELLIPPAYHIQHSYVTPSALTPCTKGIKSALGRLQQSVSPTPRPGARTSSSATHSPRDAFPWLSSHIIDLVAADLFEPHEFRKLANPSRDSDGRYLCSQPMTFTQTSPSSRKLSQLWTTYVASRA